MAFGADAYFTALHTSPVAEPMLLVSAGGTFVNGSARAGGVFADGLPWLVWVGNLRDSVPGGLSLRNRQHHVAAPTAGLDADGLLTYAFSQALDFGAYGFLTSAGQPVLVFRAADSSGTYGDAPSVAQAYTALFDGDDLYEGDTPADIFASLVADGFAVVTNATDRSDAGGAY